MPDLILTDAEEPTIGTPAIPDRTAMSAIAAAMAAPRGPVPPLVLWGNPVLEQIAYRVTDFGEETQQILADLKARLNALPYGQKGYGLAAPQIGIQKAIAYIRTIRHLRGGKTENIEIDLINPIITRRAERYRVTEGCLSIPKFFHTIDRFRLVTVYFRDAKGEAVKLNAKGLLAQVIQHECDHLAGTLMISHCKPARGCKRRAQRCVEACHG